MTAAPEQVLQFVEPMPGFDDEQEYTLSAIDDHGVLLSMRSVRNPGLRFVLTSPEIFFDDYQPDFAPVIGEALGQDDANDTVQTLLVLTIGEGLADATANMRAPIVVAPSTGRAMQVVLDDETLPMHRPLATS